MKTLRRISKSLDYLLIRLSSLMLAVMTIIVIVQVFFRYVLRDSLYWSEEVARHVMIWMLCVGFSSVTLRRREVTFDYFLFKLPRRARLLVQTFLRVVVIGFLITMVYYGFELVIGATRQIAPATGIPMRFIYLAFPVGMSALAIQNIVVLVEDILTARQRREEQ